MSGRNNRQPFIIYKDHHGLVHFSLMGLYASLVAAFLFTSEAAASLPGWMTTRFAYSSNGGLTIPLSPAIIFAILFPLAMYWVVQRAQSLPFSLRPGSITLDGVGLIYAQMICIGIVGAALLTEELVKLV
jgi:hypothetical protein